MKSKLWQKVFLTAALWNFSAALVAFWDIDQNAQAFYLLNSTPGPILRINLQIFWWTVLTFGAGYLIVARDPRKNHGLLTVAAAGKLMVGTVWIRGYFDGLVNEIALLGGIGDIAFALVFLSFVWANRKVSSL